MLPESEIELSLKGIENGDELNAMMRQIAKPATQAAIVNQIKQNESGSSQRRRVALDVLRTVNPALFQEVITGKRQLSDKIYYAVRRAGGNSIKLITKDGNKQVGITNLSQGMVDNYFIALGVKLEMSWCPKINTADLQYPKEFSQPFSDRYSDVFPSAEEEAKVNTGEYAIRVDGRDIVEGQPISQLLPKNNDFRTSGDGIFWLDNPKFFAPKQPLEFNIDTPEGTDAALVFRLSYVGIEFRP
ncbi:MAG TPA: hypothetical protein DCS19_06360 [Flavobacterium sp.]|nr:hypothetical protein [Flavobacterium sp.]